MTKKVRIENADTNDHKVLVQVWEKSLNDEPDILAFERRLDYPTAMADDIYLTNTRYLIVKEAPSQPNG